MSNQALTWAFRQDIPEATAKFVLVALANFATETGKTYVSSTTLCGMVCATMPTIRRALEVLEKLPDENGEPTIKDTGQRVGATKRVVVWQLPSAVVFQKCKPLSHSPAPNVKAETTECESRQRCPNIVVPNEPKDDAGQQPGGPTKKRKKKRAKGEWVPVPKALATPEFLSQWEGWLADRRERGKPVTQRAAELQLAKCEQMGVAKAIVAVKASVERGYQGIFEQHNNGHGHQANNRQPADRNAGTANASDSTDWNAVARRNAERLLGGREKAAG